MTRNININIKGERIVLTGNFAMRIAEIVADVLDNKRIARRIAQVLNRLVSPNARRVIRVLLRELGRKAVRALDVRDPSESTSFVLLPVPVTSS